MMEHIRESKWLNILMSVLLAVLFWLYVRAELDPSQTSWFYHVPVEITGSTVLTRQGLTVANLSQSTVDLRIEGPASVLDSLSRSRKDLSVTLDVSKCTEGENKLVYTPNWPVNINTDSIVTIDRDPETITVTVEKLYTSSFNVEFQLKGTVADGYQAGTPAINPETVVVSGPAEQVSRVKKVVAVLETEDLDQRFAGDLPLILLDENGEQITDAEVTLDSPTAYVVLPVVVVKDVPLTVNFQPGGGATIDDITYEINPKSLMVSGAESDMESLSEISLGSVDLSKVVGTNTFTFPIDLDASLENVTGSTSATVTVTVNGLDTRSFDVDNIQMVNIPDGYQVTLATQVRTVKVRGKQEDLNNIDASQLSIVADLSDVDFTGLYSVPASKVKVYLNADSSVGVIGDYTVVVNVSR
ncbi:CdaR family protein [Lawsonibacter sp. DFI.6.74]|nr:CdaR family protein [Lawsonibacter sp. DFI.6.74]MCG4771954.1 CdaR family protein [Lawsonibacter sp. DFI.5.51]